MPSTAEHIPGYRPGTWTLDPAHSEAAFSVRHLAISKVKGVFERFEVTVRAPGVTRAGVEPSAKIDRNDFGVSWNAALEAGGTTLGDDVSITFDLEFTLGS